MIENFFTEERRIKGLINEAVNEERQKSKQELEKEMKAIKSNEIRHLAELNVPKEKIIEVTNYPVELVEEVLNKSI